jgi:tetratricopeptide (TPR) repeat protein
VALSQTLGDPWQLGWMLTQLGWTHLVAQGDLSRAASLAEQGLALVRELGNQLYSARVHGILGEIRRQQGKLDEARMLLEEGLAFFKKKALQNGVFEFQISLARLLAQQGQVMEAQALYHENRALLPATRQKPLIAEYLEGWGVVLATLGAPERAARLWGSAEVLREAIDTPMLPIYREVYAQAVASARTRLSNDAFAAAWNEGRSMTPAQALAAADTAALALPTAAAPTQPPVSKSVPEGLTPARWRCCVCWRKASPMRRSPSGWSSAHSLSTPTWAAFTANWA